MSNFKLNYVFKYDKQHNLYNYLERDMSDRLHAYYSYNYKNNSLIRYDKQYQVRVFIQYEEPSKLVQRFEAGESWIRAVTLSSTTEKLVFPKMKKQFAINSENQIVKFSIPNYRMEQW